MLSVSLASVGYFGVQALVPLCVSDACDRCVICTTVCARECRATHLGFLGPVIAQASRVSYLTSEDVLIYATLAEFMHVRGLRGIEILAWEALLPTTLYT